MWPGIAATAGLLLGFVLGVLVSRGRGAVLPLPSGGRPGSLNTTELHDGITFQESIERMIAADE